MTIHASVGSSEYPGRWQRSNSAPQAGWPSAARPVTIGRWAGDLGWWIVRWLNTGMECEGLPVSTTVHLRVIFFCAA